MFKKILKKIYFSLSDNAQKKVAYYYSWFKHFVRLFIFIHHNILATIARIIYRNKTIKDLNLFEQRFYSQNGEDGILKIILEKVKATHCFCVEFGIHPMEGNTIYLKTKNWDCLWMDGNGDGEIIKKEYITAENINDLLVKYKVPREFDVLSIDVDFNDYWIWRAIKDYYPRVVIIEYNSSVSPKESKVVEYDANAKWDGTNYFGASLLALKTLGDSKGYTLVACEKRGTNAFFVRNDLLRDNFQLKSIEEIYQPPHYGCKVNNKYLGHPTSDRQMKVL